VPTSQQRLNRHSRTRSDHATETAEDYVEAIAALVAEKGICRAVDLARQFQVSHVTVNRTIQRLKRQGLVHSEPYGPVTLTEPGKQTATVAHQRHETVSRFLIALGVSEVVAAIDAEGIEHHVSPETLAAMEAFVATAASRSGKGST
jgi:DtxR family manganese transport transcriptional regulator